MLTKLWKRWGAPLLARVPRLPVKPKPWQRRVGYGLFAALAFLLALRWTFPAGAVKERLIMEAAAQGWQLSVEDASPAGIAGVRLENVSLESRDGLRIPVERVDASLVLWRLLLGRQRVMFDARLFDGRVKGFAEEASGSHRVAATVSGVDLARAVPLRRATGVDLAGKVGGEFDLTLDDRKPAASAGTLDLAVADAAVNGGQVPVPGMGGTLTLPRMPLGAVTALGRVKDGRFVFERLEAKSEDLEASGDGLYCVLQPRLAFAPIFGKARVKFHDGFWTKGNAQAFKGLAEMALAPARGPDGAYGFQIFGSLSQPQARMAPP